ncbi:helix-turn-helix transcriptional regulator [Polaromonas hydrogenivorans]|uniref:helix-turn-helix transcriptional regulator n=1 Tax=Polaromonas hydrogenivorans TaxID=335476 RepID=UPI0039EEDEC1
MVHQSKPVVPRDRLIRLEEVEKIVGFKKSAIYAMLKKGTFVPSIRLSARLVVFPESAVLQWVQDLINQGTENAVQAPAPARANLPDLSRGQ